METYNVDVTLTIEAKNPSHAIEKSRDLIAIGIGEADAFSQQGETQ